METKLKPFDLEKAKAGAKVVTRDGRSVRIICWDRLNTVEPIVALVESYGKTVEEVHTYTNRGEYWYEEESDKDLIAWLEKQGEQKEYTFKSLPRLLDMIEPTDRAKAYCQKLIDTLAKEGYNIDAKIVGECLKTMNGEDVPMGIMDEKQGEQKPDKVEPKFKVGDWVVNDKLEKIKKIITNL